MSRKRKVCVDLTVKMVLQLDDKTTVCEVIDEMDYSFNFEDSIVETEIKGYEIKTIDGR